MRGTRRPFVAEPEPEIDAERSVDEAEVAERLGEVPEQRAARRIDLLGEQSDVVRRLRVRDEDLVSLVEASLQRERLHQPEAAEHESSLGPTHAGGVVVAMFYGGSLLWGLLPNGRMSWQGHLFGAIGGVIAAWMIHGDHESDEAGTTASTVR